MQSSWPRNALISIGAYWVSRQLVVPMSLLFGRLLSMSVCGDSVLAGVSMGIMESTGRAVCAAIGAVVVMLMVQNAKPHRWGWVVAILYVIFARGRFFPLHHPPTTWDRALQTASALWPAIVCVTTALLIAKVRGNRGGRDSTPDAIEAKA